MSEPKGTARLSGRLAVGIVLGTTLGACRDDEPKVDIRRNARSLAEERAAQTPAEETFRSVPGGPVERAVPQPSAPVVSLRVDEDEPVPSLVDEVLDRVEQWQEDLIDANRELTNRVYDAVLAEPTLREALHDFSVKLEQDRVVLYGWVRDPVHRLEATDRARDLVGEDNVIDRIEVRDRY